MDIQETAASLRAVLDGKTAARERGLAACRACIRSCGNAIRAMHRLEKEAAEGLVTEAQAKLDEAHEVLADHPELLHAGFVHDAEKEFVEARVTLALIAGEPLPTPDDLKATPQAYLKGMAESIGELRRHILDIMRKGNLERCEELLGDMDEMYYVLVSMDHPDGITMGLRRLTDVARSIIERTRGDFTTSTVQKGLQEALQQHAAKLEGT